MYILMSLLCGLILITAYCMGVWTGSRFYCQDGGKRQKSETDDRSTATGGRQVPKNYLEPVELRKRPLRGNTDCASADLCKSESAERALEDFTDAERQQRSADALTDAEQQSQFFRYLTDAERQQRSADVLTDAEKQKRFEEDLKAFQDCMNYCQEKAYGVET